jgi:hypothetical protein
LNTQYDDKKCKEQNMLFLISSQAAETSEEANTRGSWITVGTYPCCTVNQHEIYGLESGLSYAVRAVLIDELGGGYYGSDVQNAVYKTACYRKLTQLTYLKVN